MRTSRAVYNFGEFIPNESQKSEDKPKKKAKATKGFSLKFDASEQIMSDKQSTPIDMLNSSSSPPSKLSKPDSEIKTVSRHVVVEEEPSDIPFATSNIISGNTSLGEQSKRSDIKEQSKKSQIIEEPARTKIDMRKQEQSVQRLFIELEKKSQSNYLSTLQNTQQRPQQYGKIHSFFTFREILLRITQNTKISKRQQVNQAVQQLSKLISSQINNLSKEINKELSLNTFPEIFLPFLTNNLENYTNQLLQSHQIQKALTVANLSDKTLLNVPSKYATTNFKSQLNCLRQKDLQLLKRSSWILQLGLVIKFFKPENIFEYAAQIIERQFKSANHVLPSEFLLFCLQATRLSKQRRIQNSPISIIRQQDIVNLVKSVIGVSYRQLWQLSIILKPYRRDYQKAYRLIIQSNLRKLKKTKNLLQVLSSSGIQNSQITLFFNVYKAENQSIKENPQDVEDLKKYIFEGLAENTTKKQALKLTEWVQFQQLEDLQRKKNYEQYLIKFVENYEKLQNSDFVSFEKLLQTMRSIITDFRICCNYKVHKRAQTYQLLCTLERKINSKKLQYLDIVSGCKSFLELKQGIFCLNEKPKLKSIEYLYQYLTNEAKRLQTIGNQTKRQYVMKVLKSIEDTLLKMLQTNSGQIYLSELCKQLNKQKERLFEPDGINLLLESKGSSFSILMRLLGENKHILNKTALILGFK